MDKESLVKIEAVCPSKLALAEVKDKLGRAKSGPQYWRCLEELAQTDGFFEMLHREFPRQASMWPESSSRRDFLKLMSASMALAGLAGCVKIPVQPIVPYVRQPNEVVLGNPLFFASAMPFGAYGSPVLVESHEGRPTKIERTIPSIQQVSEEAMSSRKLPSSTCTIPTARSSLPISASSGRGAITLSR